MSTSGVAATSAFSTATATGDPGIAAEFSNVLQRAKQDGPQVGAAPRNPVDALPPPDALSAGASAGGDVTGSGSPRGDDAFWRAGANVIGFRLASSAGGPTGSTAGMAPVTKAPGAYTDDKAAGDGATEAATVGTIATHDAGRGIITPHRQQRAIDGFRAAAAQGGPGAHTPRYTARSVLKALKRTDLPPGMRAHVADVLVRVGNGVMDGTVEPNLNNKFYTQVRALGRRPFNEEGSFRGALAQMTRVSQVLKQGQLAPGTKLAYDPNTEFGDVSRAGLPKLDEPGVDADLYFRTKDGALHIESAKYAIKTLADKVKEAREDSDGQINRQGAWASRSSSAQPRQLGFFVLDKTTGFDQLMDDRNVEKLAEVIPERDWGTRNVVLGDRKYSLNDLRALNVDADTAAATAAKNSPDFDHKSFFKDIGRDPDTAMRAVGRTYGEPHGLVPSLPGGALAGALVGATVSTVRIAVSGEVSVESLGEAATGTAQGAAVGVAATALERAITPPIDRAIGATVQEGVTRVAAGATIVGSAEATGLAARTLVTRMAGATIVGAVASGAISAWENRTGIVTGESKAIGNVAADTAVGIGAVLAATAAGAAYGSFVPGAGTLVGAVVGFGFGISIAFGAHFSGARDAIANRVSDGVDAVKSWF